MKNGLQLNLTYEYKRFSFDSRSSTFEHNESGLTRKSVLDYFGNKLKSYSAKINQTTFLQGASKDFNELLEIFYKEKIGANEPDRKRFIKKYQLIIDDITIKILTNPININDDFDFEDDILSKDFNIEQTLVDGKHLNDDFDFDEFNFEELDTHVPKGKANKEDNNKDEFDFSEFDEPKPAKNEPTFFFSSNDYKMHISFKHMSFNATGKEQDKVYALQNLATMIFIHHEFLTAEIHPEWLYSALESDLTVIFNNITTVFKYKSDEDIKLTDQYLESSLYLAILNYKNKLAYFKKHKPFNLKHQ